LIFTVLALLQQTPSCTFLHITSFLTLAVTHHVKRPNLFYSSASLAASIVLPSIRTYSAIAKSSRRNISSVGNEVPYTARNRFCYSSASLAAPIVLPSICTYSGIAKLAHSVTRYHSLLRNRIFFFQIHANQPIFVGFEVFIAVTMNDAVSWDVTPSVSVASYC
jgi:hypothetical protein